MIATEAMTSPKSMVFPAPPDFPVIWENPDDGHLLWRKSQHHYARQLKPLEGDFLSLWEAEGHNQAAEVYERLPRNRVRHINTYIYNAEVSAVPPDKMQAQAIRAQEKLNAAIARLDELWYREWLPEIKAHLAYWDAFDLPNAAMPELLVHLNETLERMVRLKVVHWLAISPAYLAISQFVDLYHDLFGAENPLAAYKLLQGFDNKVLESGRALWALSCQALTSPEVCRILKSDAAAEVPAALAASPAGQTFLAELRAYLEAYGQRSNDWGGLADPAWIEEPTPVIKILKDYLDPSDRDPNAELAVLSAEREQAVTVARNRLKGYPQPVVARFEALLKAAQMGMVISEDHTFWIDFIPIYKMRRVLLEFGRRFAQAGVIDTPEDIFYLKIEELRQTATALPYLGRRSLVVERQAEMERFQAVNPPLTLGREAEPPPTGTNDPLDAVWGKMFVVPAQPEDEPHLLRGNAGSPGKVRGPAKILHSITEAAKLKAGDILVAEMTAPPWTPLFATAAAVVTDTGGALSHCAVVAREYRIPAVVGTSKATSLIRDGQLLEVDGDAGIVRIISKEY